MLSIHEIGQKLDCNKKETMEVMERFGIKMQFMKKAIGRGTWYCDIDMAGVVEIRDALNGKRNENHIKEQNEAAKTLISLLDKIDYAMVAATSQRAA